MPTIPSLERRTVTPQTRVASVDPRGAASLGRDIGQGIERAKSARDRFQLADANSKFAVLRHQQDNAFDEDMDYGTIEQRWDENVGKGFDEIANGISDPQLRNFFVMENRQNIESGRQKMRDVAFSKERDVQRGNVNGRLNQLREVALGDDPSASQTALQSMNDVLDAAAEAGYYSAEESAKIKEAWKQDTAKGYVNVQTPEDQIKALDSDIVKNNLPSDVRAQMMRRAQNDVVLTQATDIADKMIDMPRVQANQEFKKYTGKLRTMVEQRYDANVRKREQAELEQHEELHQDWYLKVVRQEEGFKEADLLSPNNKAFNDLDVDFQKDLLRAAAAVADNSARKVSNAEVQDELHKLYSEASKGKGSFARLREYYAKNIQELSPSDQDKWSKISWDGSIPDEYKSPFSVTQRVDDELAKHGIMNIKDSRQVRGAIDDWMRSFPEGQEPNDEQIDKKIDKVVLEVTTEGTFFDGEDRYYRLTPDERSEVRQRAFSTPDEVSDDTLNVVMSEALEGTSDTETFTKMVDMGLSNPARLSEDVQETFVEELAKYDPNVTIEVIRSLQQSKGVDPSALEVLEGYKYVVHGE